MSYRTEARYLAVCDRCGEWNDSDGWADSHADANEDALHAGWQSDDEGTHYCPRCRHVQCRECLTFAPDPTPADWRNNGDDDNLREWYCPTCWKETES